MFARIKILKLSQIRSAEMKTDTATVLYVGMLDYTVSFYAG